MWNQTFYFTILVVIGSDFRWFGIALVTQHRGSNLKILSVAPFPKTFLPLSPVREDLHAPGNMVI